jgi:hypothetical protein
MSHPDEGHCQACIGDFCTAEPGCVATSNPVPYECPNFEVTCAGCGKVGGARDYMLEEGDRWECPPCWEKFEAQEKAVCDLKKAIATACNCDPTRWADHAPGCKAELDDCSPCQRRR